MKKCIVEQSCGLGDILLSSKIGCHYASLGYEVIWPVEMIYKNLSNNITTKMPIKYPHVHDFYDGKSSYEKLSRTNISEVTEIDNVLYLPLRRGFHSNHGKKMQQSYGSDECNMFAKFGMCGLNYDNWQNYFSIIRNYEKESELEKLLGVSGDVDIHLVNREFGTPPRWRELLKRDIETPKGLKRLEMKIVDGYDIFDWIGIFEKSKKIDTVTTSNFYIFEKIDLSCIPTIYSKNNNHRTFEENFGWKQKLASKEYEYIS